MMSEMANLRARAKTGGRWLAVLHFIAAVAMAVARYI